MERLICIHFPVTFTDLGGEPPTLYRRQCDTGLKARLRAEAPAVLKWFVEGAMAWYASKDLKSAAPAKVRAFSKQYCEEQDRLAVFLKAHCRVSDGEKVSTVRFLGAFNESEGCKWTDQMMAARMKQKGYHKKKARVGGRVIQCFMGLELLDDSQFPGVTSSKAEDAFRKALESRLGYSMPKCRPVWLRSHETGHSLELDFYDAKNRVAIEYDGPHHYEYPNMYHKTESEFCDQQKRDRMKEMMCTRHGVTLIRVRAQGDCDTEVALALQRLQCLMGGVASELPDL